jgi:hypothetical protein
MDRRRKNRSVKRSAKAANQIAAIGRRAAGGRVRTANQDSPIKPFYSRPRSFGLAARRPWSGPATFKSADTCGVSRTGYKSLSLPERFPNRTATKPVRTFFIDSSSTETKSSNRSRRFQKGNFAISICVKPVKCKPVTNRRKRTINFLA